MRYRHPPLRDRRASIQITDDTPTICRLYRYTCQPGGKWDMTYVKEHVDWYVQTAHNLALLEDDQPSEVTMRTDDKPKRFPRLRLVPQTPDVGWSGV